MQFSFYLCHYSHRRLFLTDIVDLGPRRLNTKTRSSIDYERELKKPCFSFFFFSDCTLSKVPKSGCIYIVTISRQAVTDRWHVVFSQSPGAPFFILLLYLQYLHIVWYDWMIMGYTVVDYFHFFIFCIHIIRFHWMGRCC